MINKNLLNIIIFTTLFFVLFSNFGLACDITCDTASCIINNTPGTYICLNDTVVPNATVVTIHEDNQTLDCQGNTLIGLNDSYVNVSYVNNITIKNCIIRNMTYGIYAYVAENLTLINNSIYGNMNGLYVAENSVYLNVTNNTFGNNTYYNGTGFVEGGNFRVVNSNWAYIYNNSFINFQDAVNIDEYSDYARVISNYFNTSEAVVVSSEFNTVSYNIFQGVDATSGNGINVYSSGGPIQASNNIVCNNVGYNVRSIVILSCLANGCYNNTVCNNILHSGRTGITILSSRNSKIYNNSLYNMTYSGLYESSANTYEPNNNTIYNNSVYDSQSGIKLVASINSTIENNTAYNCDNGIIMYDFTNRSIIVNNIAYNNTYGIYLYGYHDPATEPYFFSNFNNTLNSNIAYNNTYGIYIFNSSWNNLSSNIAYNNTYGIYLDGVSHSNLINNTAYVTNSSAFGTTYGIYLTGSYSNTIFDNTAYNTTNGIISTQSLYQNFTFNTAYNCSRGILIDRTNFSNIINNTVYKNTYGIYLNSSHNNTLINNTAYNTTYAIYTNPSTNNTIAFNTAFNSTIGIGLLSSNNTIVRNNTAYVNTYATYFNLSRSNTIQNNTARNSQYGVYLLNSTSNTLSGNRAYNNSVSELYTVNSSGNTMSDFRITTLNFLSIDTSGDLSFKEGNLTGVTMPTTYQNISRETINITNSSTNAWTTINLTYNPSGISDESTIILAHYNGTDWETNTSLYTSNFSVNTAGNYIYANITDFSMYMIMSPVVAEEVTSSTGGGGFPSTTYETDLDSVENFVLRISDAVFFPFKGSQHKLRILNMGVGSVYLEVSSDPVKINIATGETKNVDLDSDGIDDISIYLEKIENNKAYITVTAINTDESDDAVLTDETIEDVKEELDISEDDIEIIKQTDDSIEMVIDIGDKEFPMIYGIIAVLIVIAAAGWYFYKKE